MSSFAALERQLRPIYDSLDTGSNKSAVVACNKLLKKHPGNELVKALKALALVRLQKVEESLVLCDEVLASKPTDDAVLTAMMHVLRGLGRNIDTVTMFEEAFKQQPSNEELGAQTFFANVRAGHWKSAQQIATRMHKQFHEDRYLYWSVISTVLQANDTTTPSSMKNLLYKLAHRLITSGKAPSYVHTDRFHLHLSILRELELYDEARVLLDHDVGKSICAANLACDELRRDITKLQNRQKQEGEFAESKIVEKGDRNWLEFLSFLDAVFILDTEPDQSSEAFKTACLDRMEHARQVLEKVSEKDGKKDRSGPLALLELEKRARSCDIKQDDERLLTLLKSYFEQFGDKACCYEDLQPYVVLDGDDLSSWTSFLESVPSSITTTNELQRRINVHKLLRCNLTASQLTLEAETTRASLYFTEYLQTLPLGANLPNTELQPADDLAILAGCAYVNLWTISKEEKYLYIAASLLEYGLLKSNASFLMRLMLVRIYRLLGAPTLALEHYRAIQTKQVQHDTLSHFILSRASTFSLAATGDLTFATECLETSQIYLSNSQETADFVVRAFTGEKYSQIPEFITFEDHLDNSLQRDIIKMEHVRMRFTHEVVNSDIMDLELIELKFIFDRNHHDNRDFQILPDYQPRIIPNFNDQTMLFGRGEGHGWLMTLLRMYIRALQQSSDLDDTVEEKLLIGDRPKLAADSGNKAPLRDRLRERPQEDLAELTPDEVALLDFTTGLADWLGCHHDYIRPPPSVVLAEAAKQSELKTGHPLKGVEILPTPPNGSPNGHHKKDEEAPAITEPPEIVVNFFNTMKARFDEAQQSSVVDALHVATLIQEAFIFLVIETLRFKSASVIKIYKLNSLVQSFKAIKTNAVEILKDISVSLGKQSDRESTAEARKVFTESCSPIVTPEVTHEFVLNVAKKVGDARKKVLEGVGKGMTRVCSNHSQ
ncbi:hypothetical protein PC9H_001082 [Pleurotus ostreatus]|uniref:Actin cytoskeleton organization protein n=1 Tax=Pleurotus ostreatus TaxID=5322 RepID=A0A8H7DVW0_PLEOS|nr:uncharacterized protein PC9H_001082 [Pleurotus ostreatus]KAF7440734.1 hypothetical protein PC9H_001082 [Pleurotus ostreatus]KAJ8699871.1 mitochondrial distribution and morphology [Pleurotus ostreatus]